MPGSKPIPGSRPPKASKNKGPQILNSGINKTKYNWKSWQKTHMFYNETWDQVLPKTKILFLENKLGGPH